MTPEDFKNCPGCEGGKKWPEDEPAWNCPVCALIYIEDDEESDNEMTSEELIKNLRGYSGHGARLASTAADRIEQLERELDDYAHKLIESNNTYTQMHIAIDHLEAKLTKAIAALDEALYFLDPDEEDIAKGAGLYRIVTTHKELKGE